MSFFDEAREEAAKDDRGYRPHPAGQFPGKVEEVRAFEHEGRTGYEIKVRTEYGVGKQTFWRTSEADLPGIIQRANGDQAEGIARLKKAWARVMRTYTDLGLAAPGDEVLLYESLGQRVNKPCWLVVRARPDDPQNPVVFINAPRANGIAKLDTTTPMAGAQAGQTPPPAAGQGAGGWAGDTGPSTAPQSTDTQFVPF